MSAPSVFTREALVAALKAKSPNLLVDQGVKHPVWSAAAIGGAITHLGLTEVIAGRHDGRAVTFARGFEIVFGERLK
jgi:hypothetical protein